MTETLIIEDTILPPTDENIAIAMDSMGKVQVATEFTKRGHRRSLKPFRLADGRWFVRYMNQYHRRQITGICVTKLRGEEMYVKPVHLGPVENCSRPRYV